jgi:hypothetical protein
LPGGYSNPIINQLGILSADRRENSFLVRRDGTIAWSKNGLDYKRLRSFDNVNSISLYNHIIKTELEAGLDKLREGDYSKAIEYFSGFPVKNDLNRWYTSLFYGRAIAKYLSKDYEGALSDINTANEEHLNQFNHSVAEPSQCMIYMYSLKAKILKKLNRGTEFKMAFAYSNKVPTSYPTTYNRIRGYNVPYEVFNKNLHDLIK